MSSSTTRNVAPAKALSYYMGPVHWLDALTPPLEQHLARLAASLTALLKVKPSEAERFRFIPRIQSAAMPPTKAKGMFPTTSKDCFTDVKVKYRRTKIAAMATGTIRTA